MKIDWGILIGILGIVASFFISLFFFIKGKKKKKLLLDLNTTVLVSENLNKFENLKISYDNKEIKSLNSSTIVIRNIGNDIIEPNDIVPSEPIVIETSGNFLIQDISKYSVECSNPKNRAKLNPVDEKHISVDFDFLNPKDEIRITILHSGNINISGDLKRGETKNFVKNELYKKLFDDDMIDYTMFSVKPAKNTFVTTFTTILGLFVACILIMISISGYQYGSDGYLLLIPLIFIEIVISILSFIDKR